MRRRGRITAWLDHARTQVSGKSPTGDALKYIAKYWDGLILFLTDGRIEMDSNAVERTIRPIALQRKNALFAGHDVGAQNWAMIASLTETCKLNNVEPHSYITGVLTAIVKGISRRTSTSCYRGTLEAEAALTLRTYESGLYYYRARSYDPETGMFVQSDPIGFGGGAPNIYGYVSGNPYHFSDRQGLSQVADFGNTSGIVVGGAKSGGFQIGTSVLQFAGRLSRSMRDLSKIHAAPGSLAGTGPPNGDCTPKQHRDLEDQKDRAEELAKSCHPKDSVRVLSMNLGNLAQLRFIRTQIMELCFRGGDQGHQKAADQVQNRINTCNDILAGR